MVKSIHYNFCVIGAGVAGMSSAYCLAKRFPGCSIRIVYSNKAHVASNHGFGFVSLRSLNEFDNPKIAHWSKATLDHCAEVFKRSPKVAKEMGISVTRGYHYDDKNPSKKGTYSNVLGASPETFSFYRDLTHQEYEELGIAKRCKKLGEVYKREIDSPSEIKISVFGSYVVDGKKFIEWTKRNLYKMARRGEICSIIFEEKDLERIKDIENEGEMLDLVINCSGVGAKELVKDDKIVPIRGQYLIVRCEQPVPLTFCNHTFVCPKQDKVCLGSVYQLGEYDTSINAADSDDILNRCRILVPELEDCEVLHEDVGIRPARIGGARVELEKTPIQSRTPIIHNYGHGAKGFIQHWGCAVEVANIASVYLTQKSKL